MYKTLQPVVPEQNSALLELPLKALFQKLKGQRTATEIRDYMDFFLVFFPWVFDECKLCTSLVQPSSFHLSWLPAQMLICDPTKSSLCETEAEWHTETNLPIIPFPLTLNGKKYYKAAIIATLWKCSNYFYLNKFLIFLFKVNNIQQFTRSSKKHSLVYAVLNSKAEIII